MPAGFWHILVLFTTRPETEERFHAPHAGTVQIFLSFLSTLTYPWMWFLLWSCRGDSHFKAQLLEPSLLPRMLLLLLNPGLRLKIQTKKPPTKRAGGEGGNGGVCASRGLQNLLWIVFSYFTSKTPFKMALCTQWLLRLATREAPSLQTTAGEDWSTIQQPDYEQGKNPWDTHKFVSGAIQAV